MLPRLCWLMICALSIGLVLLSPACKSKSAKPKLPSLIIIGVSPSGIVGIPGQPVQFSADLSDTEGEISYLWDFGNGAVSVDDVTSPTPTVILAGIDEYQGNLRVIDDNGMVQTPFSYEVVAGAPVITGVSFDSGTGLPLAEASGEATVYGEPEEIVWDFGGGADPNEAEGATPAVRLWNPGLYEGTVTASNGAGTSDPFPFSFAVLDPEQPEWTLIEVLDADSYPFYPNPELWELPESYGRITAPDGRLTVLQNYNGGLRIIRANVDNPTGPEDFATYALDPDGTRGWAAEPPPMVRWRDRLALLYFRRPQQINGLWQLMCAISVNEDPQDAEDWTLHAVVVDAHGLYETGGVVLVNVNDEHLVAAYARHTDQIPGNPGRLFVSSTSLTVPEDPEDWDQQMVPDFSSARVYSALLLHEQLHVMHGGGIADLYLSTISVEALVSLSVSSGWETQVVASGHQFSIPAGWLLKLGAQLGIAYRKMGESRLRVAAPGPIDSETVWRDQMLLSFGMPCFGAFFDAVPVTTVASRAAIVVRDECNGGYRVMRQIHADPLPSSNALDAWDFFRLDQHSSGGGPSLCDWGGEIAVARFNWDEGTRKFTLQILLSNGPV